MGEYGGPRCEPQAKARREAEIVEAPVLGEYGGHFGAPVLGEYGGHFGAPVTK